MPSNEGKACDAVLKLLEQETGQRRADVRHPEIDGRGPPVDLRLKLGGQEYAIEHTQIEAFEGQIRTAEEFGRVITPVTEELSGTLPGPAVYYLHFPLDARLGIKAGKLDGVRRSLVEWVQEQAQRLHDKNPDRPTREKNPSGFKDCHEGVPPGFPYSVTLHRKAHWAHSVRHDGVLVVSRIAPEDVEKLRKPRLQQALDRKLPKLYDCKQEGARTVLVLEDGDIALTDYVRVSQVLSELLIECTKPADQIYLVETITNVWAVRRLKDGDGIMFEGDWSEFDSAELTDITG